MKSWLKAFGIAAGLVSLSTAIAEGVVWLWITHPVLMPLVGAGVVLVGATVAIAFALHEGGR